MAARRKDHLKSGTLLDDRYIIGDVLGEGGFGITYAARNSHNDTRVAVKEFYCREYMHRDTDESSDVHLLSGDDESRFSEEKARFLKEARTLRDFADLPGASCVGPGKSNLPFKLRWKAGDCSRVNAGPIDLI